MSETAGIDEVIQGYAGASVEMIPRFEAISSVQLYMPVADLLPAPPSRIVDIGAGTGRDAAWLATMGHDVTAVEPVDALREAGIALHRSLGIAWLNDRLPDLFNLKSRGRFDCLILSGVWQHLDDDQRRTAMHNFVPLMAPGAVMIMSLRHGPGAPNRPVYEARPKDTIDAARGEGFRLVRERNAESVQSANRAAGVHWTWLAFELR